MASIAVQNPMQTNNFETRLERIFKRFFDDQPVARVFAVNMALVGLSNIISDAGNVNRALIRVWGIDPLVVHLYMAAIVLASAMLLLIRKQPPPLLFLAGISYILLILSSVFALAVIEPSLDTLAALLRIGGLESMSLYFLIKLLRLGA
jgi:hypothetical protein